MGWGYTPPSSGGGGGGTTVHGDLTGRSDSDSHPISAITDLQDKLDAGSYQYINVVIYIESAGYLAANLATLLATDNALQLPNGYRAYVFDNDTAVVFISHGASDPPTLSPRQPAAGDVYVSHLYSQGMTTETSHRVWYVGADNGPKYPHSYIVRGDTQLLSGGGEKHIYNDGLVIADLSDDLLLTPTKLSDEDVFVGRILVTALNGHTLTINGTVNGVTNPTITEGSWEIGADGSGGWVWLDRPSIYVDTSEAEDGALLVYSGGDWVAFPAGDLADVIRPTLASDNLNHTYIPTVASPGSSYSLAAGLWYQITLTENCDFTFGWEAGNVDQKMVFVEADTYSYTFPSGVLWQNGTAPGTPTTPALWHFFTFDGGTTVYGRLVAAGFAVD